MCPRTAGERWCRKAPKGEKPPEVANSPECGSCLCIKPLQPPWLRENHTTALHAREKQPPLVAGATTFAPVGSVSLDSQSSADSLQHGYHRLTGFSGRSRSLTNPIRWCDSSSLATPLRGGTMGLYEICICVTSATWRKARAPFPRKGAINCGDSRHHNPRAKGPSNLRPLRP